MKFQPLIALLSMASCLVYGQNVSSNRDQSGDIIYPTEGTVWHVGELVNVTFKETTSPTETVALFFDNDRVDLLAAGQLSQRVFYFTVSAGAISKPGSTSLLLAVHRDYNYLKSVDAVNVKVVPAE